MTSKQQIGPCTMTLHLDPETAKRLVGIDPALRNLWILDLIRESLRMKTFAKITGGTKEKRLNELIKELEELERERNRQYWLFTRTARGKPVEARITRRIADIEKQLRRIRNVEEEREQREQRDQDDDGDGKA